MRFQPHRAAFTLIELLVVIAVIALLTGLLVPVLGRAREKARRVACMGNIRQFIIGIQAYASDYGERLPLGLSDFREPEDEHTPILSRAMRSALVTIVGDERSLRRNLLGSIKTLAKHKFDSNFIKEAEGYVSKKLEPQLKDYSTQFWEFMAKFTGFHNVPITLHKTARWYLDFTRSPEQYRHFPWEPITANQQFRSFRDAFQAWFKKKYKQEIITSASLCHDDKRPDFIFLHLENSIKLVEIKPPGHVFNDNDWVRLNRYYDALEEFLKTNKSYHKAFPNGFNLILISDGKKLNNSSYSKAYKSLINNNSLERKTWEDLLRETKQFHQSFLDVRYSF